MNKSDQAVKAASKPLQDLLGEPRRRRVRPAQRSQRAQTQATEAAAEEAQAQAEVDPPETEAAAE